MAPRVSQDRIFSLIQLVAILAILGAGIAILFPKEAETTPLGVRKSKEAELRKKASAAKTRAEAVEAEISKALWTESNEQIEATALAVVDKTAKARGVRISGFRPQKPMTEQGLTRVPFLVSVEGTFPAVCDLARDLGTRENRLAVNIIQVASADAASDRVNATIGILAFRVAQGASSK